MRFDFVVFLAYFLCSIVNCSCPSNRYTLTTTWDGRILPDAPEINISITRVKEFNKDGLSITIDAPFYDDPKLPSEYEIPGRVPGLWNYEVVEIFFLGSNEKYLEIELGPKGHYLIYYLEGVRNVTKEDIHLKYYSTSIENASEGMKKWTGKAFIPFSLLPPDVSKFNVFAIHKSNEERVYMSLFPVPVRKYREPNFHLLEYFQSISFKC